MGRSDLGIAVISNEKPVRMEKVGHGKPISRESSHCQTMSKEMDVEGRS